MAEEEQIALILLLILSVFLICIEILTLCRVAILPLYRIGFKGVRWWADAHPITSLLVLANIFATVYGMGRETDFAVFNHPTAPLQQKSEVVMM
jgi:hypothetical protein